ncbi:hypothetical protein DXG01_014170, partial [Tephrocybe rancida]
MQGHAQFTAYAQRSYPFNTPIVDGQDPLNWWLALVDVPNAEILVTIGVKLFSATPNSIADERTMSAVTMINTARRNKLSVETMTAMVQVREYYRYQKNIKRVLHLVDDQEDQEHVGGVQDESEDELEDVEDVGGLQSDHVPPMSTVNPPAEPSPVLPIEEDDDINMASFELEDLLADTPVVRPASKSMANTFSKAVEVGMDEVEEGGSFELGDWA